MIPNEPEDWIMHGEEILIMNIIFIIGNVKMETLN